MLFYVLYFKIVALSLKNNVLWQRVKIKQKRQSKHIFMCIMGKTTTGNKVHQGSQVNPKTDD